MSLISQKDRKLAIEALEFYRNHTLKTKDSYDELQSTFDLPDMEINQSFMMELNALINWVKLEYQKHEN